MSPTIGTSRRISTIGATTSCPTNGSSFNHASGGVGAAATSGAAETASDTSEFVTGFTAVSTLGTVPKVSRRAAASNVHIAGDCTGAVGAAPANGSTIALIRPAIAVATTSTRSCGAGGLVVGATESSVTADVDPPAVSSVASTIGSACAIV